MSAGGTGSGIPMPKGSGSPRTMVIGMGVVATGLLAFFFGQSFLHKRDDQPWLTRHSTQHPENEAAPRTGKVPKPGPPLKSLPLPGNADASAAGGGVVATAVSLVLGKGFNPSPSPPENPSNIQQPAPQRRNELGQNYTKAGEYKDSYKRS